jgi:hypothetical protein
LAILSWFENYSEKELPPENLWDDSEGLDQHWKLVRERRANEFGGGSSSDEDSSDGGDEMMGNELANAFKN